MKSTILFLLISFLSLAKNCKKQIIKADGLYVTQCSFKDDEEGDKQYLRFYPNGKVISIPTDCEGNDIEISNWFYIQNKETEYLNVGDYKVDGNKITFSTTSKAGTVKYRGRIMKDGSLKLKSHSLINGYKNREEFRFVKINNLK